MLPWGFVCSKLLEDCVDAAGFVLIDSLFRPVYANPESIKILGYPNAITNPAALDGILTQKILSFLPRDLELQQGVSFTQFQSGKRHYLCRAFVLEDHWNGDTRETRVALLFERGLPGPPGSSKTHRKLAGMSGDAFSFAPDPRFYYFGRGHQEVFASIRSLVRERRGIGVILAQAGMGKTALLEYLAETLRPESEIALMPGSFDSRADLVRGIMGILGMNGQERDLVGNLQHFESWLGTKHQAGRLVTLLCDDAQELSTDALENLCRFSELQAGQHKLLQVVLAGRQGLLEKLNEPRLESAGKMIHVYGRLAPMDEAEVRGYILHRLRIAGCTRQLFTSAALASIALYSRGIPLNVNMICRHSMSLAATINMQTIDERIVADSAYDLVLRAQPTMAWDDPFSGGSDTRRQPSLMRDRRGLRLVQKTNL
jgi:general secretion pathway protein A